MWLEIASKGSGIGSVTYPQALEVALCYGWIDGQRRARDGRRWLLRVTPRRPRSRWSRRNRESAERLIAAGAMKPAGLREVERARRDGRWDAAYDGQRDARVPDDLRRALDADARARQFFATLDGRNRYAILYRIQDARLAETRARRIREYVAMLREHRTIHP